MNHRHGCWIEDRIAVPIEEFLQKNGTVFEVFNQQDSGNVSYGLLVDGQRWFIKHSEHQEMIDAMQSAAKFNSEITHPCLPRFVGSFSTPTGFALVYEWINGEVLGTPKYPGESGRNNPDSPHYRFRQLEVDRVLDSLTEIYELHSRLEESGYVAVDFYDGAIMYDFDSHATYCIDLDHYVKGPFILQTDRLYGSSRFMAPEEFIRGSLIDNVTNVFTLGATAFVFLADGNRSGSNWRANRSLLEVATRAVQPNRHERYSSIREFFDNWIRVVR